MNNWTLSEALTFCRLLEDVCPKYGFHVALTGGLLYKNGSRKDCDIVLYSIREHSTNFFGLTKALKTLGVNITQFEDSKFVQKATYNNKKIDFMWPEASVGDYL